ncbi:MAG: hypothetical protein M3068_14325 [Gemmatimonadota bacterium]|nr:hypothetical protein [Gemmatimonadota bacterium]
MSSLHLVVALGLGAVLAVPVRSQARPPIEAGTRVRVTAMGALPKDVYSRPGPDEELIGSFSEVRADSLYLMVAGAVEKRGVPLARIRRLAVSSGVVTHALGGAGLGLLAGAALMAGIAAATTERTAPVASPLGKDAEVGIAAVVGAVGGLVVGGVIGARTHTERWTPVSVDRAGPRLSIQPLLGRANGFAVRLRL